MTFGSDAVISWVAGDLIAPTTATYVVYRGPDPFSATAIATVGAGESQYVDNDGATAGEVFYAVEATAPDGTVLARGWTVLVTTGL